MSAVTVTVNVNTRIAINSEHAQLCGRNCHFDLYRGKKKFNLCLLFNSQLTPVDQGADNKGRCDVYRCNKCLEVLPLTSRLQDIEPNIIWIDNQ